MDLPTENKLQCINNVAILWATAPQSNQFLAHDLPETWPNPWELLADNYYDDVGLALGIYYTLQLSGIFKKEDIHYNVLDSNEGYINTVRVEDQVLNYDFGMVVNTKQITNRIIYQYGFEDLAVH